MNWKNQLIILLLTILIISCKEPFPENTIGNNESIPYFNIQLVDSAVTLSSQSFANGNPFIVFIFDPECVFCQSELGSIIANLSHFKANRIYMVTYASQEQMISFYERHKLSKYKNITMGRDTSLVSLRHFKLNSVPYTLIYDKKAHLKRIFDRKVDAQILYEAILRI